MKANAPKVIFLGYIILVFCYIKHTYTCTNKPHILIVRLIITNIATYPANRDDSDHQGNRQISFLLFLIFSLKISFFSHLKLSLSLTRSCSFLLHSLAFAFLPSFILPSPHLKSTFCSVSSHQATLFYSLL